LKKNSVVFTAVLFGFAAAAMAQAPAAAPAAGEIRQAPPAAAPSAPPTRIAVINLADAMQRTKEGQKAGLELQNKFGPKKVEFDQRQADIDKLTDRLSKGAATLSEDAQRQLRAEIQTKSTNLKRFGEDSQAEMETDEAKISQELQIKMQPLLHNFAIQNNFAVVMDIGGQSPVLWYASATNITDLMVALYDQAHPVKDEPAVTPKKPVTPPTPPLTTKKQ